VLRGTTFLAARPDFRLSPVVARRSGSTDSAIDLTPDPETSVQITVNASQNLKSATDSRFRQVRVAVFTSLSVFASLLVLLKRFKGPKNDRK
jgi:hypothetical protein